MARISCGLHALGRDQEGDPVRQHPGLARCRRRPAPATGPGAFDGPPLGSLRPSESMTFVPQLRFACRAVIDLQRGHRGGRGRADSRPLRRMTPAETIFRPETDHPLAADTAPRNMPRPNSSANASTNADVKGGLDRDDASQKEGRHGDGRGRERRESVDQRARRRWHRRRVADIGVLAGRSGSIPRARPGHRLRSARSVM